MENSELYDKAKSLHYKMGLYRGKEMAMEIIRSITCGWESVDGLIAEFERKWNEMNDTGEHGNKKQVRHK
jgi:hypothetical protein